MTQRQQIRAPGGASGGSPPPSDDPPRGGSTGITRTAGSTSAAGPRGREAPDPADPGRPEKAPRDPRGRTLTAVLVSLAVLAAVGGAVVALTQGNGNRVRVEGPVPTTGGSPPSSPHVPVRSIPQLTSAQLVRMITAEPAVPESIKSDVRDCGADGRHLLTEYGDVTRDGATDVLVNVKSCADGIYLAAYSFANRYGKNQLVLDVATVAGVHGTIRDGDILVSRTVYDGDKPAAGSDKEHIRYSWNGQQLVPVDANPGKK